MPDRTPIDPVARAAHLDWLRDLTQIPTAAGREDRVIRWIKAWAAARTGIMLAEDQAGNLTLGRANTPSGLPVVYYTAHLDHPAFVVERVVAPTVVELSFRGGVMSDYFTNARVRVFDHDDGWYTGTLTGKADAPGPFTHYTAELERVGKSLRVGDVGVWDLPPAGIVDGCMHTHACDDLAAAAAALAAFDVLLTRPPTQDVRLLLTRAEEVGFLGAIAAVRLGTVPKGARILALENSRSFPDSPIGGGPIVRVGDRISIFSPRLTDAVAKRAEQIAGGPAQATAQQKNSGLPSWKWQRKLMAGGACEASVFCEAGYECTCVCLPLGNYHNMGDLAAVQAGTNTKPATIEREFIAVADYEGLVDLLVGCGVALPASGGNAALFEKLYTEKRFVLGSNL
ncbi:MAG: hypothetical protein HBSAPP03_19230 [Phycisphaerae bacterium]|nr:MAG: hypothetical protein HBSAPP03_19230 [Phycisphaerae bacterium]